MVEVATEDFFVLEALFVDFSKLKSPATLFMFLVLVEAVIREAV